MTYFEKNLSYFFEIIRTNNRIRNIINDCETDNIDDIQNEEERDNVKSYLKNRGCISINRYSGYLKYTRNDFYNSKNSMVVKKCDIELSPDNKRNVFESIKRLLHKTLQSEIIRQSCKYSEYCCKEHTIYNNNNK